MTENTTLAPVLALTRAWATMTEELSGTTERTESARLRVFLDCRARLAAFFRSLVDFVEYVEDLREADVRIQLKTSGARGATRTYAVKFIGMGRFENIEASARIADVPRRAARRRRDLPLAIRKGGPAALSLCAPANRVEVIGRP